MSMATSGNRRGIRCRKAGPQRSMRSAAVVVRCELTNDAPEMSLIDWDQIVQTLAANSPDYPLAICIRHRTSNRSFQDLQTKPVQRLVDLGREYSVAVADQITMAG